MTREEADRIMWEYIASRIDFLLGQDQAAPQQEPTPREALTAAVLNGTATDVTSRALAYVSMDEDCLLSDSMEVSA